MTMDEMASLFSLERIGPSPSRFDHEKLAWLNGQYLQDVPDARLLELLRPFGLPAGVPGRDAPPGAPAPEAAREDPRRARDGPRELGRRPRRVRRRRG